MATKSESKDLSSLIINKVASPAAFNSMVSAGQINEDELYLVAGDEYPNPSDSAPSMDGTANAGSSDDYARADHVHPTDTSRAAAGHTHTASDITSGLATVATSGSYNDLSNKPDIPDATSDLTNDSGFITSSNIPVTSVNSKTGAVSLTYTDVGAAASSHGTHVTYSTTKPVMDGTASVGTATTVSRSDHVHPTDTSRAAVSHTHSASDITSGLATVATSGSYTDLSNKPDIPDTTSDLTNDSGFITSADIPVTSVNSKTGTVSLTYTDVGAAAESHGTHVTFDATNNPQMDGTAAKGTATTVARSDHVHPTDTTRAAASDLSSHTGNTTVHITAIERSNWNAKADTGDIPTALSELTNDTGFITASDIPDGATASTTTPAMDGTAAVGTEAAFARGDHVHPTDTSRASASDLASHTGNTTVHITASERTAWNAKANPDDIPTKTSDLTNDSGFITSSGVPVTSVNSKTGAVSLTYTDVGAAAASHGTHVTFTTTTPVMDGTAAVGTATTVSRSDHVHPTDTSRAAASDLSTHTGDTTAHITAAERSSWNAKAEVSDIPAALSDLTNDSGFITNSDIPVTSVNGQTGDVELEASDVGAVATDGNAYRAASIPMGQVDSTSTSTVFTATVPGITELRDGVCVWLKNGVVTSASGFTLNINGLGAKPVYGSLAAATRATTIFNTAYTMLFIYNSTRVSGGCWDVVYGYDSNTNTIGYQLRTNSTVMVTSDTARYYKIYFTSADGTKWVPASVNSTNNATTAREVNQRPIDPFGRIVYTSANTSYAAGADLSATTIWDQYVVTLGYSFNRTGAALTLTSKRPVYIKCAPQNDGSAIIDADTPYVQALPSTEDGKIYIFLGVATSATAVELVPHHPVYYYKNGIIQIWTGQDALSAAKSYADSRLSYYLNLNYNYIEVIYDDSNSEWLLDNTSFNDITQCHVWSYVHIRDDDSPYDYSNPGSYDQCFKYQERVVTTGEEDPETGETPTYITAYYSRVIYEDGVPAKIGTFAITAQPYMYNNLAEATITYSEQTVDNGSGGGVIVGNITYANGTYSCDLTYAEIRAAIESGASVVLEYSNIRYALDRVWDDHITFTRNYVGAYLTAGMFDIYSNRIYRNTGEYYFVEDNTGDARIIFLAENNGSYTVEFSDFPDIFDLLHASPNKIYCILDGFSEDVSSRSGESYQTHKYFHCDGVEYYSEPYDDPNEEYDTIDYIKAHFSTALYTNGSVEKVAAITITAEPLTYDWENATVTYSEQTIDNGGVTTHRVNIANGNSVTLTLGASTRAVLYCMSNYAAGRGEYLLSSITSGATAYATPVLAGSGLTVNTSGGAVTVTNSAGGYVYCHVQVFTGDVTIS